MPLSHNISWWARMDYSTEMGALRERTGSAHALHQTSGGCADDKVNGIIWEGVKETFRRPQEGEGEDPKIPGLARVTEITSLLS